MPDVKVNVITDVKGEEKVKALNKTLSGTGGLSGAVESLKKAVPGLSGAIETLSNPVVLASAGIAAAGAAARKSVQDTMAYALSVKDMSRSLGTSTEEASKLIQVADDLRVEQGTLKIAFRNALKDGITPNMEGLIKLSAEYQKLSSPSEKAQFALEKFGRSGLEMQKILEKTPEQLRAMSKELDGSARVMSEKSVKAAEDYWKALDDLNDKGEDLKYTLGKALIPVLTDVVNLFNQGTTAGGEIWEELGTIADLIHQRVNPDYADLVRAMELAGTTAVQQSGDAGVGAYTKALKDNAAAAEEAAGKIDDVSYSVMELGKKQVGKVLLDDLKKAFDTKEIGFDEFRAQNALVMSQWFDMPASEVNASLAIQDYQYQMNQGKISAMDAFDMSKKTFDYWASINGQNLGATFTFNTVNAVSSGTNYHYTPSSTTTNQRSSASNTTQSARDAARAITGHASGADYIVPPGYNETWNVGTASSGERVTITPSNQTNGMTIDYNRMARAFREALLKVM